MNRIATIAVLLVVAMAVSLSGTAAEAGNGHGHGKGKGWKHSKKVGHVKYSHRHSSRDVVYVERPAYVVRSAPVYRACAPRYVSYVSPRYVVIRPAPYVRVGARIGSVDIGAVFGPDREYVSYDYGCNFCDAHFSSFSRYDRHVHGCAHRPANVHIQARVWDDQGYGEWRDRDGYRRDRDDDRYEDRYYDEGYDG